MTKRCNLTCDFCHYDGELDRPEDSQSKQSDFLLEDFIKLENKGTIKSPAKVCLYGGEPMLSSDFFNVVDYLNNNGYISSTITNGTFLKLHKKSLLESRLHQITISYYDNLTYKLGDIIKDLSKVSLINISLIISEKDYIKAEEVVKFAIDCGAKFITIENIIERESTSLKSVSASCEFSQFKQRILNNYSSEIIFRWSDVKGSRGEENRKINCSEPWDMILLDKSGRVLPCCQYPLKEFEDTKQTGADAFNGSEIRKIRTLMKNQSVPKGCEGCHYLYAKDPLYRFKA